MNNEDVLEQAEQALQNGAVAAAGEMLLGALATTEGRPSTAISAMLARCGAAGHEESKLATAMLMLQENDEKVIQQAFELLSALVVDAQSEDTRAQAHATLGNCYIRGSGVKADEANAFYHYQQAAEYGVPQSAFKVALAYEEGLFGQPMNIAAALKLYVRAAAAGHAQSMANIVLLYMSGKARLPLDDAVQNLLQGPLPGEDQGSAAMIYSSRETLLQWAKEMQAQT